MSESYTDCKTDRVESKPQPDASRRLLTESETVKTLRQTCPVKDDLPNGFPKTQISSETINFAPSESEESLPTKTKESTRSPEDVIYRRSEDPFAEVYRHYSELKEMGDRLPTTGQDITKRDLELVSDRTLEVDSELPKTSTGPMPNASNVLDQFRFNGNLTHSETTGANHGPDFFPTRWNGVDLNRDAAKLSTQQEQAEKEFLEKAAKDLEKQNLKLKPLHKGEGPYQAIERMVRSGALPHMTSEQIKEHAVRIRNRDFEQMKRGYYKVGETPEFYSKQEMAKMMEAKKQEFRQRLKNEQKKAA